MSNSFNATACLLFLISSVSLISGGSQSAVADQPGALDVPSQKALQETQALLTTPTIRTKEISKDPSAVKWDQNVDQITGGGERKEELYQITSDIMKDITLKANGDPLKMQEMMERAKSNPEAFFKSLSPEQQAKITDLSTRVPAAQAPQPTVPK